MAKIEKFEDLVVWQKARELNKLVFEICKGDKLSKDYDLSRHLRKTSGSIMDNIAEGFERGGNSEFRQFLSVAKASAGEIRSQFYRCFDFEYISKNKFDKLYDLAKDIGKMSNGLIE